MTQRNGLSPFITFAFLSAGLVSLAGCGGSSSSGTGSAATAGQYTYTDLGSINGDTAPSAINDSGVIVGSFAVGNGESHAFRHSGAGPITAADDLGVFPGVGDYSRSSSAAAVNSTGLVAGNAQLPDSSQDVFVYDTAFHDLSTLTGTGITEATVTGINDAGVIVGQVVFEDQNQYVAFRHSGTGPLTTADELGSFGGYTNIEPTAINRSGLIVGNAFGGQAQSAGRVFAYDTSFHDLGGAVGTGSNALAVNNSGVIVGFILEADGITHAFRHSGLNPVTATDDLGVPSGFTTSVALAVNTAGDTVGNIDGPTASHAFVCLAGGKIRDLNDASLVSNLSSSFGFQNATGINASGQIAGYTRIAGVAHAWLLTPSR